MLWTLCVHSLRRKPRLISISFTWCSWWWQVQNNSTPCYVGSSFVSTIPNRKPLPKLTKPRKLNVSGINGLSLSFSKGSTHYWSNQNFLNPPMSRIFLIRKRTQNLSSKICPSFNLRHHRNFQITDPCVFTPATICIVLDADVLLQIMSSVKVKLNKGLSRTHTKFKCNGFNVAQRFH